MPTQPGNTRYNFKDLLGVEVAGFRVVDQLPSTRTGTEWQIQFTKCGHLASIGGGHLRLMTREPPKNPRICRTCRPKGARAGDSL